MKQITLYPYQEEALSKLNATGTNILSICPGGGKTYTALEYINRNAQFKKVLILSHGTKNLRNQWAEEMLGLGIEFSQDITSSERIVLQLPHSLNKIENFPQFDLVVIDEAHEFYFAKMIKNILKKSTPKCTLLLTGTPSKFILKTPEIKPVIMSAVKVYNAGFLASPYIATVTSSYKLDSNDYNTEGEVEKKYKFLERDTAESFDKLVKEMLKRLVIGGHIDTYPHILNTDKNLSMEEIQQIFTSLDKTLIIVKSISQSNVLLSLLLKNKINAVVSNYKADTGSEKIEKFINDKKLQVLIVVNRAKLGFNMPDLVNVVNFKMTRNIDQIYQIYARVLRKRLGNCKKFYFHLCSNLNPNIDSYYLQAALTLTNEDFISKFNGKNLKNLEVLVHTKNKEINFNNNRKATKNTPAAIDKAMAQQILDLDLMSKVSTNPNSEYWKEYEYANFGEIIEKLTGKVFDRQIDFNKITKETLSDIIKTGRIDESLYC